MKKQRKIILYLLFFSFLFADDTVFNAYSAIPDANQITIKWKTKNEDDIKHFKVQRSTDDATFNDLKEVSCNGPGYPYEYVDNNIMVNSGKPLYYRIVAVKNDGSIMVTTESMRVNFNLTGVFRTWGAIKAMFK